MSEDSATVRTESDERFGLSYDERDISHRDFIYKSICNTPGIRIYQLSNLTAINRNTLRYHLRNLISEGKVRKGSDKGYYQSFFDNIPEICLDDQICDLFDENPNIPIHDIAFRLNISRQLTLYYINKLDYANWIERKR